MRYLDYSTSSLPENVIIFVLIYPQYVVNAWDRQLYWPDRPNKRLPQSFYRFHCLYIVRPQEVIAFTNVSTSASKFAETGKNDLTSTTPKLMVHKWWNVFESRWGMKEHIHRLPGQGFGSSSTQLYPSLKQNRSDLSVFVCSPPADTQSERKRAVWPQ